MLLIWKMNFFNFRHHILQQKWPRLIRDALYPSAEICSESITEFFILFILVRRIYSSHTTIKA